MFTYPTGVKKILYNGGLQSLRRVPAGDWYNFCALADAEGFIKRLQASSALSGFTFTAPFNDPESPSDYDYDDPNQPIQMWDTTATDASGLSITILLGDLMDRETRPNVFEDIRNPDGTTGGPVLHLVNLGYTYVLSWGK